MYPFIAKRGFGPKGLEVLLLGPSTAHGKRHHGVILSTSRCGQKSDWFIDSRDWKITPIDTGQAVAIILALKLDT